MTKVFTIEPNPRWVIIDDFSKLPNGAAIYTYRTRNPTEFKPAFQDAGGTTPYGQPITGFGNGTMPPIFWEFDDAAPDETYYIEVWSGLKQEDGGQGVRLWTFDGLSGGSTGGGGSTTTNNDIENLIVNGEFYRNIGNQLGTPSLPTFLTLAPSTNAGIGGYENSPDNGPPSPDIIFAKKNQTDSDSLSFVTVSPFGSNNLGTIQPTPQIYVKYTCTVGGTSQTYKYIQFPVVKGLQNLSSANVSVKIWAKLVSGNPLGVTLNWRQFFGNGGAPSADVITPIGGGPITLDSTWKGITINDVTIPSVNFLGSTPGSCGNDALYFQIAFPTSDAIDVEFILPCIYLGKVTSNFDFHTLDEVDAIVNSPRTGDIRTSISDYILGWIRMNNGTIGSAASGATSRANQDTFPLFDLIWRNFQSNQGLAPMFNGTTPIAYGASSVADFTANRRLSLTKNLGRVMAGALPAPGTQAFTRSGNLLNVTTSDGFYTGMAVTVSGGGLPSPLVAGKVYYAIVVSATAISLATTTADALAGTVIPLTTAGTGTVTSVYAEKLGDFTGEEMHLQAGNEVGVHNHGFTVPFSNQATSRGGGAADTVTNLNPFNSNTSNSSQNVPMNIMQPTVYMNVFIKL